MLEISEIADGVRKAACGYPVKRVDLFGSYAEGRQGEGSDVDLLVEFDSATVSLLALSSLRQRIEGNLGVPVDLLHAPLPDDSFLEIAETVVLYEN